MLVTIENFQDTDTDVNTDTYVHKHLWTLATRTDITPKTKHFEFKNQYNVHS
jgi:hypothetical protein